MDRWFRVGLGMFTLIHLVVAGRVGVAIRHRMGQAAVALRAALPVELHLDAVVAVRVDDGASRAHHDGGLLALYPGPRWMGFRTGAVRRAGADRIDAVAVQGPLADGLADRVQARLFLLADQGVEQSLAKPLHQAGLEVGAEVVVHQVHSAHHQEAALVVAAGEIELREPAAKPSPDVLSKALETPSAGAPAAAKSAAKPVQRPKPKPTPKETKKAPAEPATTPEQESDIALLSALVAHAQAAEKAETAKKPRLSLKEQLAQCKKFGKTKAAECRARVCEGRTKTGDCKVAR